MNNEQNLNQDNQNVNNPEVVNNNTQIQQINSEVVNNPVPPQVNNGNSQQPKKTNGFAIAGFILSLLEGGILALIFSIVGLVKSKTVNSGKGLSIAGIIISIVRMILLVLLITVFTSIFVAFFEGLESGFDSYEPSSSYNFDSFSDDDYDSDYDSEEESSNYSNTSNPLVGYYNCMRTNTNEYSMSVEFKDDMTFRYGSYDDLDNNHYAGSYIYQHEKDKDGIVSGTKYYMISLAYDKADFVVDGEIQEWTNGSNNGQMEFGINDTLSKKEGALIFVNTYNTYLCVEK